MKIVGVINEYKEAKDIEDIVRVFTIEKRISDLFQNNINKSLKDDNTNMIIFSINNMNLKQVLIGKHFYNKNNDNLFHIFNVRGFN